MNLLSASTVRRLTRLKKKGIWEGDRRPLPAIFNSQSSEDLAGDMEWVLWVDETKVIRAMDIVQVSAGPEVLVRTLIKAMEYPQGPATPLCPQRLFVRDREHQFFLRGALQDLDLDIQYASELPLIDEIAESMEGISSAYGDALPEAYRQALDQIAEKTWEDQPWALFADDEIIEIQLTGSLPAETREEKTRPEKTSAEETNLNETYYLCCLGLMGVEFGILLYRTLDSLRQFRASAIDDTLDESQLESVFLNQDCLFLNYDVVNPRRSPLRSFQPSSYESFSFGTIHPLEGIRPFLEEDEAVMIIASLEGLSRFLQRNRKKFERDNFPEIKGSYTVKPFNEPSEMSFKVSIKTLPQVSKELLSRDPVDEEFEDESRLSLVGTDVLFPQIQDDLIPNKALVSIGMLPWEVILGLKDRIQTLPIEPVGEGLAVVTIQTSRPKGQQILSAIANQGGLIGVGFAPGKDEQNTPMEIGVLLTGDHELHLFGEFMAQDPIHQVARQKWSKRVSATDGWCAVLIAQGITGLSRGNPSIRDILALIGVQALSFGSENPHMMLVPDRI